MYATGIVRKIDQLGRVVFPIELRRTFDIQEGDALEIFTSENKIVLKKYEPSCIFCGMSKNVIDYKNKKICSKCLQELSWKTS